MRQHDRDNTHLRLCIIQRLVVLLHMRYLYTKFEEYSFAHSNDKMGAQKFNNQSHDPKYAHLGLYIIPRLALDIAYLTTLASAVPEICLEPKI